MALKLSYLNKLTKNLNRKKVKMKKLFLLLCVVFMATGVNSAEFETTYQMGALLTNGGATHMAYFIGGEVPIKSDSGFVAKTRFGYFSFQQDTPEIQGGFFYTILQQNVLKTWFISAKSGFLNQVENGDDIMKLSVGFETGVNVLGKIDVGVGVDMIPTDGKGDKTFIYGLLNFNL